MTATSSALGLADLALRWDPVACNADLVLIDSDLASDPGLETAVMLSLFLDRRAENDDVPPSGDPEDRRGWWADQFLEPEGDRIGSRLWLLDRSARRSEVARRYEEYAREALAWMVEDRVVQQVDVTTELTDSVLLVVIGLARPGRETVTLRFARVWDAP